MKRVHWRRALWPVIGFLVGILLNILGYKITDLF